MSAGEVIGVALLGGLGALARFSLDWAVSLRFGLHFPFGTLAVNLSGAFLLGVLAGAGLHGRAFLFAGLALLGAYTTFSTWMLETHRLAEGGHHRAALANLGISAVLGLGMAALGHALGAVLWG
ncbi:MAG TPA: fluoride efflux transporter CrcB [Solirubrobacterales bacterium]|nr:fluoride efflux transporter CrcB [Solirubrobacterales bacterium]